MASRLQSGLSSPQFTLLKKRLIFFLLAALIGVLVSLATVGLIEAISLVQWFGYGERSETQFASIAAAQPWWRLLLVPLIAGLIVGFIINTLPGKRYHGIADVMEACAFNSGRMGVRSGISAAIAAAVSLGAGAPLGREGPAVHIGASISAWFAEHLGLDRSQSLALLGCGAAAAVTTSFNAPIAGVIFALEVIVGYYTLRVFAPVVIASLAAMVVHGYFYGSAPLFVLDSLGSHSIAEFPLFAILGVLAGLTVMMFIQLVKQLRGIWELTGLPVWARPAVAGLLIGFIALKYPMILSIGYEPTKAALQESLMFNDLLALLILKIFGTTLALSSGFAGGVFSPSVFLGAMLGGVFILALPALPFVEGNQSLYSVAGMAAVSSAMLGAPISTILIVFEITRDYGITAAVMTSAAFASTVMQISKHSSFFRWQLSTRNINISAGRDLSLLRTHTVEKLQTEIYVRVSPTDSLREVEAKLGVSRKRVAIAIAEDDRFVGSIELKEVIAHATEVSRRKQVMADSVALRVQGRIGPETDQETAVDIAANPATTDLVHGEVTGSTEDAMIETVGQIVRGDAVSVTPSTNLVTALQIMADNDIDFLPVLQDSDDIARHFLGVIFKADVLAEHYSVLRRARDEEFGVN